MTRRCFRTAMNIRGQSGAIGKLAHPAVRCNPTDPTDDGIGRMPPYVAEMLTNALSCFERALQAQITSVEVSDDEAVVRCNDIGDIHSTAEAIRSAI